MIDQEREKLRAVAWSEIFPWLNIFRTFRLAIRIRTLLLATAAMLLIVHGWAFFDWAFSGGSGGRTIRSGPMAIPSKAAARRGETGVRKR